MASFPTSVPTLSNPTPTTKMGTVTAALKHATQHGNANDEIEAIATYLLNLPILRLTFTSTMNVLDSALTDVLFNTETYDTAGGHSGSLATFTVPAGHAGYYHAFGQLAWDGNTTGYRLAVIAHSVLGNAGQSPILAASMASGLQQVHSNGPMYCAVGATIKLQAFQTSGGTRTLTGADTFLGIVKVRE